MAVGRAFLLRSSSAWSRAGKKLFSTTTLLCLCLISSRGFTVPVRRGVIPSLLSESTADRLQTDTVSVSESQNMSSEQNTNAAASAVDFARLVGRLKTTPRTGWVRRGVPKYESVADHSWRVAVLSLLLPDDFDLSKCLALGLVHDLAECVTGDICPGDNVSKEDKARMELEAMNEVAAKLKICKRFGDTVNDESATSNSLRMLLDFFHEYEKRESKEAIAVKDLDLLDMILQASEYEERYDVDLSEFFEGTPVSRFRTAPLRSIAGEVHRQRRASLENRAVESRNANSSHSLCRNDAAFVEEFAKASNLTNKDIENVVMALRNWESTHRE